jgi:uncharacterized protein
MPITPTYPGVYVEEIPSGVRTIAGVATSVAAFVDFFKKGPLNQPVQLFNLGDFERELGGLDSRSEASYAIQQFFQNGGTECWAVRTLSGNFAAASVNAAAAIAGSSVFALEAKTPGAWGNQLRARVDYDTPVAGEFNLVIGEYPAGSTVPVRQEVFRNLTPTAGKKNSAATVVNDPLSGSKLVKVTAISGLPLLNGTYSDIHTVPTINLAASAKLLVAIGALPAIELNLTPGGAVSEGLIAVAARLEAAIRGILPANPLFAGATVTVVNNRFLVKAGPGDPKAIVVFSESGVGTVASQLKLRSNAGPPVVAASSNTQEYVLGLGSLNSSGQVGGALGEDGTAPDAPALIGNLAAKTGLYALEEVDLFNILCLPRTAKLDDSQTTAVISAAESYCESRRAFFIMDTKEGVDDPAEVKAWLAANNGLRHKNAALYYPRVQVPDPLDDFRLRTLGASGTVAGLFARTDVARGVWKAPAGTEASLRGVTQLEDTLTDAENGTLNPLGINCLRTFPIYGSVAWGARTLVGADQIGSEWKYVPIRRLALMIEESLYRGTQWVVFEPNDEPLWSQIRLNIGAFMHNLFRQGAFQGRTPREAYLVKCDRETTTQNDINLGIVNIVVGFAPLKPAEFVILKIQQLAGQIES